MEQTHSTAKVAAAIVKAQASFSVALKDSDNPFFKSKYTDLAAAWAACQDALSENKLAVLQDVTTLDNGVCVATRILHESGEQITFGPLRLPPTKNDAQGFGSAITYARRYALMAALGIVSDDDDGNAAAKNATNEPVRDENPAPPWHGPLTKTQLKEAHKRVVTHLNGIAEPDALTDFINGKITRKDNGELVATYFNICRQLTYDMPSAWHGDRSIDDAGLRAQIEMVADVKAADRDDIKEAVANWLDMVEAGEQQKEAAE